MDFIKRWRVTYMIKDSDNTFNDITIVLNIFYP